MIKYFFIAFKPSFAKNPLPRTILAANNGNLTIPCIPEAAPVPTISWLKNGGKLSLPITDGNQKGAQLLSNGYLKIVGVSMVDAGLYTCVAANQNGESMSTGNVTVVGKYITGWWKSHTCILFCWVFFLAKRYLARIFLMSCFGTSYNFHHFLLALVKKGNTIWVELS